MKKYNEYMNEGLLSAMKPKSKEQIDKAIEELFKKNSHSLEMLNVIFNNGVDINILPRDNNIIIDKFGEEMYDFFIIIYGLINDLKNVGIIDSVYVDYYVIDFNIIIGEYTFRIAFNITDKVVTVNEIIYKNGEYIEIDKASIHINFKDIENTFKSKFKETLKTVSKKDRATIEIVDKFIGKL